MHGAGGGAARLACGSLKTVAAAVGRALFAMEGVTGSVTFTQAHASAATTVEVDLAGLQATLSGWHVHVLPLPSGEAAGGVGAVQCSVSGTGGHFDPFGTGRVCTATPGLTPDQCEAGDLSGKHGTLAGQTSMRATFTDPNLPLFGSTSIVGRSVVLHRASDSGRAACATIEGSRALKTVVARFRGAVVGSVRLQQPVDDAEAETSVLVDLRYQGADAPATAGHGWHVHVQPVASQGDCLSTGGHFNPYGVCLDAACNYSASCGGGGRQGFCETGDLAGKHGPLSLASSGEAVGPRSFFTDAQLPLSGPESVEGRSITVHGAGGGAAQLACGSLIGERVIPPFTTRSRLSSALLSATLLLSQSSPLDALVVEFHGLGSAAQLTAVVTQSFLLPDDDPAMCSVTAMGGLYSPSTDVPRVCCPASVGCCLIEILLIFLVCACAGGAIFVFGVCLSESIVFFSRHCAERDVVWTHQLAPPRCCGIGSKWRPHCMRRFATRRRLLDRPGRVAQHSCRPGMVPTRPERPPRGAHYHHRSTVCCHTTGQPRSRLACAREYVFGRLCCWCPKYMPLHRGALQSQQRRVRCPGLPADLQSGPCAM